jgi:inner membrane protein
MATVFSHGIVALALAKVVTAGRMPVRFWLASVVCAVLPDIDVIGFAFGIHYSDMLGHRGLTHSLFFALLVSLATVAVLFRDAQPYSGRWVNLFSYFFLVIMSHGILDALTNGGLGVAFFAPFDNTRYFFPWQVIEVSPIGLDFFSTGRAWTVILSEIEWIWVPSGLAVAVAWLVRRARPIQS